MRAQIQKYIRHAFNHLSDIVKDAVIKHETGSSFDDATGMPQKTYQEYPVKILLSEYDKYEMSFNLILPGDLKALLPAEQIDFVPTPDDFLIMDDKEYSIELVQSKFDILYILKL